MVSRHHTTIFSAQRSSRKRNKYSAPSSLPVVLRLKHKEGKLELILFNIFDEHYKLTDPNSPPLKRITTTKPHDHNISE